MKGLLPYAPVIVVLLLWGIVFLAVWLIGRITLRRLGSVGVAIPYGVFTDTMLALATTSICSRSAVLARRCRKLEAGPSIIPD